MGSLLSELGKKLAERWLSLLVLPGALYLAVAYVAHTLGHADALSLDSLMDRITVLAGSPTVRGIGGQAVLLAAILAGSAVVGLAAQTVGPLVERLHLAPDWHTWPGGLRRLAYRYTARRQQRWDRAATSWHHHREEAARALTRGERLNPTARRSAHTAMVRVSLERPGRPTWSGDRIHTVAIRLDRDHHIDVAIIWPHVWLILPEENRAEITTARQAITRATTLAAWALLYLALTPWWWPAAVIATTLALTSWHRTRMACDTYATLLEAVIRLFASDLAERLGLDSSAPLSPDTGDALTRHLTPSPPDRPSTTR
ncbi:hypothetical protein ABZ154_31900 [Streptomyces sp. NPDC006261]|uniref:hypothetical protein n=1 Tax=Streptomyces sp. NPDC006261 TaxID=3156739 RepID=UPI0033AD5F5A